MYVKYEVIGSHNVAVPTHFFKVILCEKQGNYSLFSYVLPNLPCDEKIPLSSYLVPLDSIERAAGFLLFDKLPRNKLKAINGK
jgi:endonuclease G